MNYYAIADIAGEFDALMRLVTKFEPDSKIILLGDMVDRGPKSKEVIEWARTNPNVIPLMGNHEHMMLDWIKDGRFYESGTWLFNGGIPTLTSYFGDQAKISTRMSFNNIYGSQGIDTVIENDEELRNLFPKADIEFLSNLSKYYEIEVNDRQFIMTHAPIFNADLDKSLAVAESKENQGLRLEMDYGVLWCRTKPRRIPDKIQLSGHNSHWGLQYFNESTAPWAICLDASGQRVLTALHLNSMKIIQEPYEEEIKAKPIAGDKIVELVELDFGENASQTYKDNLFEDDDGST